MSEKLIIHSSNTDTSPWDILLEQDKQSPSLPPDFLLPKNPILSEFIEKTYPATPENIKQKLNESTFSEFKEFLLQFNSSIRDTNAQQFDGDGLLANGYLPPAPEDRLPLLEKAFNYSKTLDAPEQSAFVLGSSILTIHPFLDGNGRTSRTIFALLTNGYSGSEIDSKLFGTIAPVAKDDDGHNSASNIIDLDPETIKLKTNSSEYWNQNLAYQITNELRLDAISQRFHQPENNLNLPARIGIRNRDANFTPDSLLDERQQSNLFKMFGSHQIAYISCIKSFPNDLLSKSIRHHSIQDQEFDTISYSNVVRTITTEEYEKFAMAFNETTINYIINTMQVAERPEFNTIIHQCMTKIINWQNQNE